MTYVIAEPCVDLQDKACIEECPVDCIYEGNRMLYIHPDECVDCGACEPVCPVEAIYYEDDVPEQWKDYTGANYEFFEDLGRPVGAPKVGQGGRRMGTFLSPAQPPRGEATEPARPASAGSPAVPAVSPGLRGSARRSQAGPLGLARLPDFTWDTLDAVRPPWPRRIRTA